jgi:hypothetical protein
LRSGADIGAGDEQHRHGLGAERRFELAADEQQHRHVEDQVQPAAVQEGRGQRRQHERQQGRPGRRDHLGVEARGNEARADDRIDLEARDFEQQENDDAGQRIARNQRRVLRLHRPAFRTQTNSIFVTT